MHEDEASDSSERSFESATDMRRGEKKVTRVDRGIADFILSDSGNIFFKCLQLKDEKI